MIESLKYAFHGLRWSLQNQKNFKIHLFISMAVLFLAFYFKVTRLEFIFLILCIILGLSIEMINTSIEEMTDLITIKWAKQAKIAKDVAAGMMFVASIGLAVVGLIIFIPYIF